MQTLNRTRNAECGMQNLPPLGRGGQGGSRCRSFVFAPSLSATNAPARHSALRTPHSELHDSALRAAFTLVEMLVVIVIIGVLMGLAIPVFMQSRVRVNEARVAMEIKGLESAITAFRSKYGVEPPSQFRLWLTQAGWNSDPSSMAIVRSIWPQFDFSMGANSGLGAGTAYPWFWANIATTAGGNKVLNMNSGECLMFFIGGIIPVQGENQVPVGFCKNPVYPFAPVSTTSATGTVITGNANANREGPFFEMTDISRIKDLDKNGINEWYDSIPNQTSPYLYFSSYTGAGYRVTGTLSELPAGNTLVDVYRVWAPPTGTPSATVPSAGTATQSLPAQKGQSFQIISPGYDGKYGAGGVYNPNLTNSGLTNASGAPDTDAYDNITNFSGGKLKP